MSGDDQHNRRRSYDYGPPYPYRGDRYVRDPYEERTLRDLDRANDPYASPQRGHFDDSPEHPRRFREKHRGRRRSPPPVFTVTAPDEDQRDSIGPQQRRGPYAYYLRDSENPPARPRASEDRVPSYQNQFGDLPPPCKY